MTGSVLERGPDTPAQRERRQRILAATTVLAADGGFDAVQMRTVAERSGVALGTLYRYFPSKLHLLVAALADRFREERLALPPVAGATAEDRVMGVVDVITRRMQEEPRLVEALSRAFVFADTTVQAEVRLVGIEVVAVLLEALRGPSYDGPAEPTDDEVAVMRVVGDVWLAGLVGWVTGRATAPEVAGSIRTAVHLLLR